MILSRSKTLLCIAIATASLLGAGCSRTAVTVEPGVPQVPVPVLRGAVAGDVVTLEEPAGIVGGKLRAGPLTRAVTLRGFTLGQASNADWRLVDAAGAELATGSWAQAALNTAHPFYLPGVFDSKTRPVGDASLLWLAQQEYRELKATSGTTIDPKFAAIPEWSARAKADPRAGRAFEALKTLIAEADKASLDLSYARQDGAPVERTITVDGAETKVTAIPVRNWYGVFEVLDREDNPLVLSFTLDPKAAKNRLDVTRGDGRALAEIVDYRVKEIDFVGK